MNIRMNSKEIKFRLAQSEVENLLKYGSLTEKIALPQQFICFRVEFGTMARVSQVDRTIVFLLSNEAQEKLKTGKFGDEPIESCSAKFDGALVDYKLDVDIFSSRIRRGRI